MYSYTATISIRHLENILMYSFTLFIFKKTKLKLQFKLAICTLVRKNISSVDRRRETGRRENRSNTDLNERQQSGGKNGKDGRKQRRKRVRVMCSVSDPC